MFPEKYNGTMVEKLWNTDRVTTLVVWVGVGMYDGLVIQIVG